MRMSLLKINYLNVISKCLLISAVFLSQVSFSPALSIPSFTSAYAGLPAMYSPSFPREKFEEYSNAVRDYTGEKFIPINDYLRNGGDPNKDPHIRALIQAVERLSVSGGMPDYVYRNEGGRTSRPEELEKMEKEYKVGNIFQTQGFTSTRRSSEYWDRRDREETDVVLKIKPKTGVDIPHSLAAYEEEEFLMAPGRHFLVKEVRKIQKKRLELLTRAKDYRYRWEVELEELEEHDPRVSSFSAKPRTDGESKPGMSESYPSSLHFTEEKAASAR